MDRTVNDLLTALRTNGNEGLLRARLTNAVSAFARAQDELAAYRLTLGLPPQQTDDDADALHIMRGLSGDGPEVLPGIGAESTKADLTAMVDVFERLEELTGRVVTSATKVRDAMTEAERALDHRASE